MYWARSVAQVFLFLSVAACCNALRFQLPAKTRKCLKEQIHKNVLATGQYELSQASGQTTNITVTDSNGHFLFKKEDALAGKFAFTTEEDDVFEICFDNKQLGRGHSPDREVYLEVKRGVEAKSLEDFADASTMKPLEMEIMRLEAMADAISKDAAYAEFREVEMIGTNHSTMQRVTYLFLFSTFCVFGLAVWQTIYLRSYFKSKKLI